MLCLEIRRLIMQYIKMTIDDAKRTAKKDAIVLVSVIDLESDDCNSGFDKKRFGECYELLEEAKCIARVTDDFEAQLRVFTENQNKLPLLENKGSLHTIVFNNRTDVRKMY